MNPSEIVNAIGHNVVNVPFIGIVIMIAITNAIVIAVD
jgi:uncharacterized protein (DUF2062 family)